MVKQNNTQQLCKHILWVYLFVLEIPEESQLINQVAPLQSEVLELTSNAPIVIPVGLSHKKKHKCIKQYAICFNRKHF